MLLDFLICSFLSLFSSQRLFERNYYHFYLIFIPLDLHLSMKLSVNEYFFHLIKLIFYFQEELECDSKRHHQYCTYHLNLHLLSSSLMVQALFSSEAIFLTYLFLFIFSMDSHFYGFEVYLLGQLILSLFFKSCSQGRRPFRLKSVHCLRVQSLIRSQFI